MGGGSEMDLNEIGWKAGQEGIKKIDPWIQYLRLRDLYIRALVGVATVTEGEYRILRENPPEGYVLIRIPHGRLPPPGCFNVKFVRRSSTIPRYKNTELEEIFEWRILIDLGLRKGRDYESQFLVSGRRLDFAILDLKLAFEPGAAYFHGGGRPLNPFGFSPEEVYSPPAERDIEKNEILKEKGWVIGWLNEKFVEHIPEVKDWIRRLIESRGEGACPHLMNTSEEYDVIHPRSKLPHKNGNKESRYICPFCESTNTKIYGTSCVCYNCFEMFSPEKVKRIE